MVICEEIWISDRSGVVDEVVENDDDEDVGVVLKASEKVNAECSGPA